MAVKIRLTRIGGKKRPIYRVVVADSRYKRDGRFLEIIGRYDPAPDPALVEVKEDRLRHWLDEGAQPTTTVASLLKQRGYGAASVQTPEAPAVGGTEA